MKVHQIGAAPEMVLSSTLLIIPKFWARLLKGIASELFFWDIEIYAEKMKGELVQIARLE
ncbi:MAG: hypothetical protein H6573_32000 [Lewinellaceae bacterium]|nr:hypothetical protein [Phaeodactylibacter sp.]MCB9352081.1 hypothetical protein [Lewinellaceae bacterium]